MFHVNHYTLTCQQDNVKTYNGCISCVFILPDNCSLLHSNMFIPATIGYHTLSSEMHKQYTLPLPILQRLFACNQSFNALLMNDALLQLPPILQINSALSVLQSQYLYVTS